MNQNNWRIIQDSLGDGAFNMAKDKAILIACSEGKTPATLRIYGWKRPTLSIGYPRIYRNILTWNPVKKIIFL